MSRPPRATINSPRPDPAPFGQIPVAGVFPICLLLLCLIDGAHSSAWETSKAGVQTTGIDIL